MSQGESNSRRHELAEADNALEDLLGTLLADVPEYVETKPAVSTPPPAPQLKESPVQEPVEIVVEADVAAVVETEPETRIETGMETEVHTGLDAAPAAATDRVEIAAHKALKEPLDAPIQEQQAQAHETPALPEWANSDFKVLVVRIGKLRVGVPLIGLNSISPVHEGDEVTKVPAQPGWHRGVMQYRDAKLVLVDLAQLLALDAGEVKPAYRLVIGDSRYGVLCDAIEEPASVDAAAVNWRQAGDRRDWCFGTLREQMCLLLDADGIAARLGEK